MTEPSIFRLAEGLASLYAPDIEAIEAGIPNEFMEAVTPVTAELLTWWFNADSCQNRPVNFHQGQRDAILAMIYAHEVLGTISVLDLYEKAAPHALVEDGRLGRVTGPGSGHPKYAAKMATGTGKTWVLNALLIWQYLNHRANPADERFTSNFLIVAPGLVVYERLLDSFQGKLNDALPTSIGENGRDFSTSDIASQVELFLPPDRRAAVFAFLQSSVAAKQEIGRKVTGGGLIAITNWHLLSGDEDPDFVGDLELDVEAPGLDIDERAAAASFITISPGVAAGNLLDALDRRYARGGALDSLVDLPRLVVFNDEAHHIHQVKRGEEVTDVEWQKSLTAIAAPKGRGFVQIDFSATPYNEQGTGERAKRLYFDHIVVDFDLNMAMSLGLVKGLAIDKRSDTASIESVDLDFRVERDDSGTVTGLSEGQRIMINAGLKKLGILEEQFIRIDPLKHPKLLIMTEDTNASKAVEAFLLEQTGLDAEDVLRVDSNRKGELGEKEWAPIKKKLFGIDALKRPKVIVSVLMLREGFDVSNICVIVPLRSAGSGILAEQVVGRGLRLMWRGDAEIDELKRETRQQIFARREPSNYLDVLFVIEHPRFINLYDELLTGGLAVELTNEITPGSAIGDLEKLALTEDYRAYDFEIPVVLRDAEEELAAPAIDLTQLPVNKLPLERLRNMIGTGDRFSSEDAQTRLRFGDYRVDGGVMTATGYNDYLARMTNRVTESLSRTFLGAEGHDRGQYTRTAQYPILQTYKAMIVGWINQYVRTRLFGEPFDPLEGENWRLLLLADVSQDIAGVFLSALVEMLESFQVDSAEVEHHWVSEIDTISVRTSTAVNVVKSIFSKIPVAARGGGLERLFVDWADSDASVEAIVKIDEFRHWFLHRAYLKADGMAAYYSPDFLVRTKDRIFVVETKGQNLINEANVQRKRIAALTWVERINELPADERSGRGWSYVLLGGKTIEDWRTRGGSVASLLEYARLAPVSSVQPTMF
jgi:type III restriction enzyme